MVPPIVEVQDRKGQDRTGQDSHPDKQRNSGKFHSEANHALVRIVGLIGVKMLAVFFKRVVGKPTE